MTVISITITTSTEQVISGIPKTVALETNVPASIFYTLDGTDPTLFSTIYTSPIHLPFDQLSITFKVMATNGTDFSPIVIESYVSNMLDNARLPHSGTTGQAEAIAPDLYPFGTPTLQPNSTFTSPGDVSITVDDPLLPATPTAFDSDGNPTAFTNRPFDLENYSIIYSITDAEGQRTPGVGNLPADVVIKSETAPPEENQQFSNMFDPRALVIFQDFSKENPDDPVQLNKQYFTSENVEKARDGAYLYSSGLDAPPVNGSFVRSFYNQRENTMTYYYYDSWANRWIISKSPFQPTGNFDGNLSGAATAWGGKVYEWVPFARRTLG
jgi:hypothetical protein